MSTPVPKSAIASVAWPAIPAHAGAVLLALQCQFERSEWLAPAELAALQLAAAGRLARHAQHTVPFYRARAMPDWLAEGRVPSMDEWQALPVVTRAMVQEAGGAMLSERVPADHGAVSEGMTSGSLGMPVRYFHTEVSQLFWHAVTLREHLWQRRDLGGKLAAIRVKATSGNWPSWGPPADLAYATGPAATLDISAPLEQQLDWLIAQDPDYLIGQPSNLRELVLASRRRGRHPQRLREVRTLGEVLPDDLRQLCREAWGVPVTDIYSASETGYLALQCPDHEHYHVQAEAVLLELLDAAGRPCAPGAAGRVVATPLHNYAMPLLRYEIGDYAEAGAACACGRGLPVLSRIMGRKRNMVLLPDGRRRWPYFSQRIGSWGSLRALRQVQLAQTSRERIEARIVARAPLAPDEEAVLVRAVTDALGHPFAVTLRYFDDLPRGPGNKFEEFVCLCED